MRKAVLYIAMSVDGYIADQSGGVAWLDGDGSDPEHQGSYPTFIQTVDTVIMGYKTYHQIITELSPDEWVYTGKTSYVITHHDRVSTDEIRFTDQAPAELVADLKGQEGKDIWICGGASIVNQLLDNDLIDLFWITVIPTILGGGVRLFAEHMNETRLKLVSTQSYNGLTDLVYVQSRTKSGEIIRIQEHPELVDQAAAWFHQTWGIPESAYLESMADCVKNLSPAPQWYVIKEGQKIIAGIGVIDNDFHDRKDLTPNVCAVFVDPACRGRGLAGKMLQFVCDEFKAKGIETLYLLTDHTSLYEKYGWRFYCLVQGDGEPGLSRMYIHTA